MFKNIEIIINPASGNDEPILNVLNDVLVKQEGLKWHISVTQPAYGAEECAREALERGVDLIVAYGGDGTQHQVAPVLIGQSVPLCILRGGTGNVLATQLEIPMGLAEAFQLILGENPKIMAIDTCLINDKPFLLNAGTELYGNLVNAADREMKEKYGWLAYLMGGLQSLFKPESAHYKLTIDGETVEQDAIACLVTNVRSLGVMGLSLPAEVAIDDGLLDCFLIEASLKSTLASLGSVTGLGLNADGLHHWQFKEMKIEADPVQGLFVDGEEEAIDHTPLTIRVNPRSLKVLIP